MTTGALKNILSGEKIYIYKVNLRAKQTELQKLIQISLVSNDHTCNVFTRDDEPPRRLQELQYLTWATSLRKIIRITLYTMNRQSAVTRMKISTIQWKYRTIIHKKTGEMISWYQISIWLPGTNLLQWFSIREYFGPPSWLDNKSKASVEPAPSGLSANELRPD